MTVAAVSEGTALVPVERLITQERIGRYADAAGDHNPIHLDAAFAAATPFGGTIAHGMLVLAAVSESLTATFGLSWGRASRLKVRFRAPARPGDTIRAGGHIERLRNADGGIIADCAVECRNQAGELLISGEASVPVDLGRRA